MVDLRAVTKRYGQATVLKDILIIGSADENTKALSLSFGFHVAGKTDRDEYYCALEL